MKLVAVISDTHNVLRPEVIAVLKQADSIIHAGDCTTQEIVDRIADLAPLTVVRGNNDRDQSMHLPKEARITIEGVRICVVHDYADIPEDLMEIDLVIYGHSHKYACERRDAVTILNPGSCGRRRFHLALSMCMLRIENGHYQIEKIDLD